MDVYVQNQVSLELSKSIMMIIKKLKQVITPFLIQLQQLFLFQ